MFSNTVELTRELIQKRSITPEDDGCQELLARRLNKMNFAVERFDCRDVSNMWAKKGSGFPHLMFVGHTDVVPAGEESDWSYPPFAAIVDDNILYGRGAADMKGGIAAMVTACERFFEQRNFEQGAISFLITSDEESVAIDGTRYVIEQLVARSEEFHLCLVGEPTCEAKLGDTMKIGRRGSIDGDITVFGKQGHVAYPHLAKNPIHGGARLLAELMKLSWDDSTEYFPDSSFQISNINAGVGAGNVIPATLTLRFNIRFSPLSTVESLIEDVENACVRSGVEFKLNWNDPSRPFFTEEQDLIDIVAAASKKVLGVTPKRSAGGGTSDGRFVAQTEAQIVEYGLLNSTIHKVNECVHINDLDSLSSVYEEILQIVFNQ